MKRIIITILITFFVIDLSAAEHSYDINAMYLYNYGNDLPLRHNTPINSTDDLSEQRADNPLTHGPFFMISNYRFKNKGYFARLGFVAEHRGFSYGVYNNRYINLFPRINLGFDDTLSIVSKDLLIHVDVGNQDNYKRFNGLTLNGLDIQGGNIYLKYKKLKFEYNKIGDLFLGVGYGIDDLDDWTLSLEKYELFKNNFIDLRANYGFIYANYFDVQSNLISLIMNYSYGDYEFYMEYSQRENEKEENNGSAYIFGLKGKNEFLKKKLKINYDLSYRNYESGFNRGLYNNYFGAFQGYNDNLRNGPVYPIHYSIRPAARWGLYTAYEGSNISSFNFIVDLDYEFYDGLHLILDLDYISINAQDGFDPRIFFPNDPINRSITQNHFYNFHKFGVKLKRIENMEFFVGYTNYEMNLQKQYPAFGLIDGNTLRLEATFNLKGEI